MFIIYPFSFRISDYCCCCSYLIAHLLGFLFPIFANTFSGPLIPYLKPYSCAALYFVPRSVASSKYPCLSSSFARFLTLSLSLLYLYLHFCTFSTICQVFYLIFTFLFSLPTFLVQFAYDFQCIFLFSLLSFLLTYFVQLLL